MRVSACVWDWLAGWLRYGSLADCATIGRLRGGDFRTASEHLDSKEIKHDAEAHQHQSWSRRMPERHGTINRLRLVEDYDLSGSRKHQFGFLRGDFHPEHLSERK